VFLYYTGKTDYCYHAATLAVVGEIARLKVVSVTPYGAFLDWGLMKDLFVRNPNINRHACGGEYMVKIYLDEQTGRVAATEKFESFLSNENLSDEGNGQRRHHDLPEDRHRVCCYH
jgi:predicted RNA-binding protein (virulence factor B family)